jgi:hypothetical protein
MEIEIEWLPPAAIAGIVEGVTVALHVGVGADPLPSWLMNTDWPATEIVASRGEPAFVVASKSTVPDPLPLTLDSRSHSAEVDAVHVHPDGVSIARVPRPPGRGRREGSARRS